MKKLNLKNNFLILSYKVVSWLIECENKQLIVALPKLQSMIEKLDLIGKSRGQPFLISYMKEVRMLFLAYLSGKPVKSTLVSCTVKGLPKILAFYNEYNSRQESFRLFLIRLILTILYSSRSLNLGRNPDITSIIQSQQKVGVLPDMRLMVDSFWKDLGFPNPAESIPKRLLFNRFHLTTKSGPSKGGNALWTSMLDLFCLPETVIHNIKIIGGPKLSKIIDLLLTSQDILNRLPILMGVGERYRKLIWFPDKELKTRIIAILDYWSQTSLRQLHSYLFSVLKRIPQDMTFDQGAFLNIVANKEIYYSIDLSNATDRFPMETIVLLLKGRLPHDYVEAWRSVMVDSPFDYYGKMISYAVGNPMGAYSSWASFSLAHHFIIYYCCTRLDINWKELPYVMLGDDLVICDKRVAELYMITIRELGMEYSVPKTHISSHLFEFAKRLFLDGHEISPFPISALNESGKKYYAFSDLLLEQSKRGFSFVNNIQGAVSLYYGMVKSLPSRLKVMLSTKSYFTSLILQSINGTLPINDSFNTIATSLGLPMDPLLTIKECNSILENIAVESYSESNPLSNIKSRRPCIGLGNLAINIVMLLTDETQCPDTERGFELITSLPILGVYSGIEEKFLTLSTKALKFTDWPIVLRTMALPWDDKIFVERSSHLITRASATIISQLKNRFEVFKAYPQLRE